MEPLPPSDAESELNSLRARAYGPDPDIDADPAARARLVELEAAHVAGMVARSGADLGATPAADASRTAAPITAAPAADQVAPAADVMDDGRPVAASGGSGRSLLRRAIATRTRRVSFIVGLIVAVLVYAVTWLLGPHPDATLRPTAGEADPALIMLMGAIGLDADVSTLREYQSYREVEPWSVVAADGSLCLMAVAPSRTGIFTTQCVPPEAELYNDLVAWPIWDDDFTKGLPDGSVIRFHLHNNVVDVFLYPAGVSADPGAPGSVGPPGAGSGGRAAFAAGWPGSDVYLIEEGAPAGGSLSVPKSTGAVAGTTGFLPLARRGSVTQP